MQLPTHSAHIKGEPNASAYISGNPASSSAPLLAAAPPKPPSARRRSPFMLGASPLVATFLQCLTMSLVLWLVVTQKNEGGGSAAPQNSAKGLAASVASGGGADNGAHRVAGQVNQDVAAAPSSTAAAAAAAAAPAAVAVGDATGGDGEYCITRRQVGAAATVVRISRCRAAGRPYDDGDDGNNTDDDAHGCGARRGGDGRAFPLVLVATVSQHNDSFGLIRDHGFSSKGPRGLSGYLQTLRELDAPSECLSLALLASEPVFFEQAVDAVARFARERGLARAVVVKRDVDVGIDPAKRHAAPAQRKRRAALARLRNALVTHALADEDYVLWLDADVTGVPPGALKELVAADKDVVTAVTKGWDERLYDWNAWQGPRKPYNPAEGENFVPGPVDGVTKFPHELAAEGSADAYAPLDSVGGCTTLVAADVHREGAWFAVNYPIGATWQKDGYDGVESEGLCYVAKALGRSCWLATRVVTYHQSFWV